MTPTRRSIVLGALLAAPALRAVAREGRVAIVGAGAAGLAAAAALRRAGRDFILLEARDRIGGRAFTDHTLGPEAPFDAGAEYIHWSERNPWGPIARDAQVRIAGQEGWARNLVIDGRPATESEQAARRSGFTGLDAALAPKGADLSLAEAARAGGVEMQRAAAGLSWLSLGEDPERISAVDYDRLWSGTDLWVDGYGDLVARHFAPIPVRLDCPVQTVDWTGPGVRLATAHGTVDAAAAIVTVPIGILQAETLRFSPRLPGPMEAALAGLGMGAYTKVALHLDPDRVDVRAIGDAVSVARDGPTIYIEMAPFDRSIAVANLGGDLARDLCRQGEKAAIAAVTDRLAAILGERVRGAVRGGRLAGWWTDPWSRGSYAIVRPGHADAREALRTPIGDRIFLAGEALADGGAMTVGGATLDGERAARAVLKLLGA